MSKHKHTDRHIDAFIPKLTTTRKSNTLCGSKFEAHVMDVLEAADLPVKHEPITFTFDDLPKGQATPDFVIPDPWHDGGLMLGEPKGGDTPRAIATFEDFCDKCDDPDDLVTSYMLVKFKFIKLHMDGVTAPAGYFVCDDCGHHFFDFKKHPGRRCPQCDSSNVTFLTDNMNKYANDIAEPIWTENWQRREQQILAIQDEFDAAKDYELRLIEHVKKVAANIGWDELMTGEGYTDGYHDGLVIGTDYAYEAEYIPDFVYEELPNKYKLFGHATPPLALVSVCEMPSENDELVFEELRETIVGGHAFVKHAILDHTGFRVLDWTTDGNYEPGAIYICDEPDCGKTYIAPHDHYCPYCDGEHHHQFTR